MIRLVSEMLFYCAQVFLNRPSLVETLITTRLYIQAGESALESVGINLIRAKELAVSEVGGLATKETRGLPPMNSIK